MTREEIKESVSMRDILARYGLPMPNRAGFIHCPFHSGDREPSMKIYDKDYCCFGCQKVGDIFTFVQEYEHISFREAFLELGGTYDSHDGEPSFAQKRRQYQRMMAKKTAEKRKAAVEQEKAELRRETNLLFLAMKELYSPLSDEWCEAYNEWQYKCYRLFYLLGWEF